MYVFYFLYNINLKYLLLPIVLIHLKNPYAQFQFCTTCLMLSLTKKILAKILERTDQIV